MDRGHRTSWFFLAAMAASALLLAPAAQATNYIWNQWKARYPNSHTDDNMFGGTGAVCQTCHAKPTGKSPWNGYGWQVRLSIEAGLSIDEAFTLAEPFNSDNDPTGSTNLEEILADAQPGWTYGNFNTWTDASGTVTRGLKPPQGVLGYLNSVWTTLDTGTLAGAGGPPVLQGFGPLVHDIKMAIKLSDAAPGAPAMLFAGLSQIDAPFKGGVLVPAADILVPLATDAGGVASVSADWPPGIAPGFDFWLQCWIMDAAGPAGFAASNGLKGTAN